MQHERTGRTAEERLAGDCGGAAAAARRARGRRRAWTRGSTPTTRSAASRATARSCSSPTARSGCRRKTTSGTSSPISAATCPRSHVVPFLTCKHTLEYCLSYADRARQHGFESLVVLGGDKHVGPPRCVEHAWQLREMIRAREAQLALGGWANPHADAAAQVQHLLDDRVDGGVLPDADRLAPQPAGGRAVPATKAQRRGLDAAGHVRRLLLPLGEPADARNAAASSCRCRSTSCARSSRPAHAATTSARDRSAR